MGERRGFRERDGEEGNKDWSFSRRSLSTSGRTRELMTIIFKVGVLLRIMERDRLLFVMLKLSQSNETQWNVTFWYVASGVKTLRISELQFRPFEYFECFSHPWCSKVSLMVFDIVLIFKCNIGLILYVENKFYLKHVFFLIRHV